MTPLGRNPWMIATFIACGIAAASVVGNAADVAGRALPLFWDFDVLLGAASAQGSPYVATPLLPFVYPPHFAALLSPLAGVNPPEAKFIYATLTLCCLVGAVIAQLRLYRLSDPVSICFMLAGLSAATLTGWLTGNLGVALNAGILVSLIPASEGRFRAFYCAVLIAALVKPYALVYMALPVLVGRPRVLLECAGVVAVCAAVYAGSAVLAPGWFSEYTSQALSQGMRDPGHGGLGRAAMLLRKATPGATPETIHQLALWIQGGIALTLFAISWWIAKKSDLRTRPETVFALAMLVCVLSLPRLKVYDVFMALGPILYFCRRAATEWRGLVSPGLLILFLASLPMEWHTKNWTLLFLTGSWTFAVLVLVWGFALIAIRRGQTPSTAHEFRQVGDTG
jgi:hypothetical protein